jgi:hypothetical protein
MAEPPFDPGAVKVTEAWALPAVAVPMVGAPGAVAAHTGAQASSNSSKLARMARAAGEIMPAIARERGKARISIEYDPIDYLKTTTPINPVL